MTIWTLTLTLKTMLSYYTQTCNSCFEFSSRLLPELCILQNLVKPGKGANSKKLRGNSSHKTNWKEKEKLCGFAGSLTQNWKHKFYHLAEKSHLPNQWEQKYPIWENWLHVNPLFEKQTYIFLHGWNSKYMAKKSYKVTSGNIKPGIPQGKGQISLLAWSCLLFGLLLGNWQTPTLYIISNPSFHCPRQSMYDTNSVKFISLSKLKLSTLTLQGTKM